MRDFSNILLENGEKVFRGLIFSLLSILSLEGCNIRTILIGCNAAKT
jgi:hypothetical protein